MSKRKHNRRYAKWRYQLAFYGRDDDIDMWTYDFVRRLAQRFGGFSP